MKKKGTSWAIHYIDDFLMVGALHTNECLKNTLIMQSICDNVTLPMEPSKSVGPTTTLVFLVIKLDSLKKELRLPLEKLTQLQEQIAQWRGRKACRKRELLSLIGSLHHSCKVVQAGRTFRCRLIDMFTKATYADHFICLNAEVRGDLEWWFHFIGSWNGVSSPQWPPHIHMQLGMGLRSDMWSLLVPAKMGQPFRNIPHIS